MQIEQEALEFAFSLQKTYLEKRDMENVLKFIDGQTSWIGTGEDEICKGFTEAQKALFSEKAECSDGFVITDNWYETVLLSPESCVVYGEFFAKPKNKNARVAELHQRISAVFSKTPNGIKLMHLHTSCPDMDLEKGEYYVKEKTKVNNKELRLRVEQTQKALHDRNKELEILTENIPGGVYQCKNDEDFTILNMSGGFISVFGYSEKEIKEKFKNHFIEMIYESDRERIKETIKRQLSVGSTIEFEYRIVCKNGEIIWVIERGRLVIAEDGTQSLFCMMMDITKQKEEQENLRLILERHKVIMDQATDIIFEWDIKEDTIDYSSNWQKKFGYQPITNEISQRIPLSENIHKDDMRNFMKIMNDVANGVPYVETEFRIINTSKEARWCRVRATTQFDRDNKPIKAIGVIVDIDQDKNQKELLVEQAERDSLTKLYNKTAVKSRVEQLIKNRASNEFHVLMMIDVDNFKNINDNFGHLCGDAVLANMAHSLKNIFRSNDILGRIGGDEFLVFMSNVPNHNTIKKKAMQVVNIFEGKQMEREAGLSCSVGIALCPQDANDYLKLTKCADSALYKIKNTGKMGFAFFDESMQNNIPSQIMRLAIKEKINDNANTMLYEEIMQYTFKLLYNSVDIKTAINQILEMIGQAYDVSRVYVFETSDDGKYCSNTFEWCNNGVTSQMNNLQNLSFEDDLVGFFEIFDENGVFYCQNIKMLNKELYSILEMQGVVSVLQCFIKEDGCFKGYVGFDECKTSRYWTEEQVDSLTMVSNVLSTFLLKLRLKEEVERLKKAVKN